MKHTKIAILCTAILTILNTSVVGAATHTDDMHKPYKSANCYIGEERPDTQNVHSAASTDIDSEKPTKDKETSNILGVVIQDAYLEGLIGNISGVGIAEVMPKSPASKAGIDRGDLITAFNGKEVTCSEDLLSFIAETQSGEKATITVTLVNAAGYFKQMDYDVTLVDKKSYLKQQGKK